MVVDLALSVMGSQLIASVLLTVCVSSVLGGLGMGRSFHACRWTKTSERSCTIAYGVTPEKCFR